MNPKEKVSSHRITTFAILSVAAFDPVGGEGLKLRRKAKNAQHRAETLIETDINRVSALAWTGKDYGALLVKVKGEGKRDVSYFLMVGMKFFRLGPRCLFFSLAWPAV